jgi:hypothetical protein
MSRVNLEGLRTRDIRYGPGFQFQSEILVPTTGFVIDPNSPPMLMLNPGGAINARLPTSTPARQGLIFIFVNISGNVITLQTDGGAAFATAITVAANAANRVVCTGNATQNLGWLVW